MGNDDFDASGAFGDASAFLAANPFALFAFGALDVIRGFSADDVPDAPQWVGVAGPNTCKFNEPVTFVWPRDPVFAPPDWAGIVETISSTPTRSRRPRDATDPSKVCYYDTGMPGDIRLGDPAANFYNDIFPAQQRLLTTEIPLPRPGQDEGRLPAFFGGGSLAGLGDQLRELQRRNRLLTPEELFRKQFGKLRRVLTIGGQQVREEDFQAACNADPYCKEEIRRALLGLPSQGPDPRLTVAAAPPPPPPIVLPALAPAQPIFLPPAAPAATLAPSVAAIASVLAPQETPMSFAPLLNLSTPTWMGGTYNPAPSDDDGSGGGGGFLDSIPVIGPLLDDFLETATSPEGLQIAAALARAGVIGGTLGDILAPSAAAAAPRTLNINGQQVTQQAFQAACAADPYCTAEIGRALRGEPSQPRGVATMAFDTTQALQTLGLFLAQQAGNGAADEASVDDNDFDITDINNIPVEILQALQRNVFGVNTSSVPDASNLFRARPGGSYLPSRIQVRGPDGQIHILINAGRATRGSREKSVMRKLARENGFKCSRYGTGGRRSRRRPR